MEDWRGGGMFMRAWDSSLVDPFFSHLLIHSSLLPSLPRSCSFSPRSLSRFAPFSVIKYTTLYNTKFRLIVSLVGGGGGGMAPFLFCRLSALSCIPSLPFFSYGCFLLLFGDACIDEYDGGRDEGWGWREEKGGGRCVKRLFWMPKNVVWTMEPLNKKKIYPELCVLCHFRSFFFSILPNNKNPNIQPHDSLFFFCFIFVFNWIAALHNMGPFFWCWLSAKGYADKTYEKAP